MVWVQKNPQHPFPSSLSCQGYFGAGAGVCRVHVTPALLTVGVDGLPEGLSLGKDESHNDAVDRSQWPQRSVFVTEDRALGTAAGTVSPWAGGGHGLVPRRAVSVR